LDGGVLPSRSEPDVITVNRFPQTLQNPGKRFAVGENDRTTDLVETAFKGHQAELLIRLAHYNFRVGWLSVQSCSFRCHGSAIALTHTAALTNVSVSTSVSS
jgi:hypothetical protein